MPSKHWVLLFNFIFKGTYININDLNQFSIDDLDQVYNYIMKEDSWIIPNHNEITCISSSTPKNSEITLNLIITDKFINIEI